MLEIYNQYYRKVFLIGNVIYIAFFQNKEGNAFTKTRFHMQDAKKMSCPTAIILHVQTYPLAELKLQNKFTKSTLECQANIPHLLIFDFFFKPPNGYLDPPFIFYSKYFFAHLYRNRRSQYKHSNIKISVIKYEKNIKRVKKDPYIIRDSWRYILLICKVQIFFLLLYIRFLIFTINI